MFLLKISQSVADLDQLLFTNVNKITNYMVTNVNN